MALAKFKPQDYKTDRQNSNFLSMGCKKTIKHGEFDKTVCIYSGVFKFNHIELYQFIISDPFAKRWCFIENRTEYFKLFFDFDIDKYLPDIANVNVNDFIAFLIDNIIKVLKHYIVTNDSMLGYIYSDRLDKYNFHLFFPEMILNSSHAIAIREKILQFVMSDNKFDLLRDDYENIIDISIYKQSGLKVLFQAKPHEKESYKINMEKSTYKVIPTDKLGQLVITSIRTNNGCANVEFIKNDAGFQLISGTIENQMLGEPDGEVKTITLDEKFSDKYDKAIIKKAAKKQQVKEQVDDAVKIEKFDMNIEKLDISKELFKSLLNNLNAKRFSTFISWLDLMFLCMNYGLNQIAHEFSQKCPEKYDKIYLDNLFKNKKDSHHKRPLTVASLFMWSKDDNPAQHKVIMDAYYASKKVRYAHTDEILLKDIDNYNMTKCKENSFRISDDMLLKLKEVARQEQMTIILHQNTGGGKTYNTNEIVGEKIKQFGNDISIISVITRRSMAATHLKAFESLKMTSYLKPDHNKDRLIVSLELLHIAKRAYPVLILDEFNSLMVHFYSKTMVNSRFRSLCKLVELIKSAETIIIADATITDMGLCLIAALRKDIFYYRNIFKNKLDINLNVYYVNDKQSTGDDKIIKFCSKFQNAIETNKSLLVLCDSATIARKLRNYLAKWNKNIDYFRLYTAKDYNMTEVMNCNKTWIKKCVVFSPKIVYGLDCLIKFDNIYAIYKCKSMNSIGFLQQISRARNCLEVDVLFLENNYKNKINKFISFEENRTLEIASYKNYVGGIDSTTVKQNNLVIQELCSRMLIETTIDEQALFGNSHMYKSWYDRLFDNNKAQLFLDLCDEQGYSIIIKELDNIGTGNDLKPALKSYREEIINHTLLALGNSLQVEIDDALLLNVYNKIGDSSERFTDFSNREIDIRDKIDSKLKYLGVFKQELIEDNILAILVLDDDIFEGCIRALPLYSNVDDIQKLQLREFESGLAHINKDNRMFMRLQLLKWIERYFGIRRFQVDDIIVTDKGCIQFVTAIKKLTKLLPSIVDNGTRELSKIEKSINSNLGRLTSESNIKKFVSELYNRFDDIILYNIKYDRTYINKIRVCNTTYNNFKINSITMNYHKKFISKLNSEYRFV